MTVLISEHDGLYQLEEPETETNIPRQQQQSTLQRCMVEWLSQEDTNPPPLSDTGSKTPKEKPQPSTSFADCKPTAPSPNAAPEKGEDGLTEGKSKCGTEEKVDGKAESNTERKDGGEAGVSPSKQTKTQPSWKSSLKGSAASRGQQGKMGGSAGDVSAVGGSNWLMNGLSSLRAHRRTPSSGERLKDSTVSLKDSTLSLKETTLSLKDSHRDSDEDSPQLSLSHRALHPSHRLSAYDNVGPSSLSLPTDTSSIWTSVEISLSEPEGSDKAVKSAKTHGTPAEVRDSANTPDHSASGTEDELTGTNEGLANMLTELKQELKKQRTSYETCIRK